MNIIKKIYNDKKEYREQMEKVKSLPEDYRFVFGKIQSRLWSSASGDGRDTLRTQYELIELFEAGAAGGRPVLDITGKDVAGFCEELMRGNKSWIDRHRERLNRDMVKQSEKG